MKNIGKFKLGPVYQKNGCKIEGPNDISSQELSQFSNLLTPASILFISNRSYVSSKVIPGKWKHVAIYLGSWEQVKDEFYSENEILESLRSYYKYGNEILILDSSVNGVKVRELTELSNHEKVSLINSVLSFKLTVNKRVLIRFMSYAIQQVGKEYDYDMITGEESKLYCSELVWGSLEHVGINIHSRSIVLGKRVVLPTDITEYIESNDNNGIFTLELYAQKNNGQLKISTYDSAL